MQNYATFPAKLFFLLLFARRTQFGNWVRVVGARSLSATPSLTIFAGSKDICSTRFHFSFLSLARSVVFFVLVAAATWK